MSRSWEDMLSNPIEGERYKGESVVLGYSYEDIQEFGSIIKRAEFYLPPSDTEIKEGLMKIWDFFEGLLGEGYIAEEVSVND